MAQKHKVAVIVGSLGKASLNRKMAHALIAVAPPSLEPALVEIGDLPLYTPDFEADPPAAVRAFRERIAASDAVLFVTPEYNRSVPGALKNAIDVGSRPYGKAAWTRKPAAIVSVSPGRGCLLSSFQSGSDEFEEERWAEKSLSWEKAIGSRGPVMAGWANAAEARRIVGSKAAQRVFRIVRS
jgi:hypothetical protein